ncbi:hypothetical protein HOK51_03650 [Candidatus Woesearchaeota archaeon]|jgi:hypothetical protein|nr:hypothetical protein [Candidatus Woesearchaeota archaeon]MBT6518916.1 hypothetical protein [Candidatus Woesearchaeota archaeon]MBT7367584.1 hypothetical protein [Candidatus Woesearchaeota archaeon]
MKNITPKKGRKNKLGIGMFLVGVVLFVIGIALVQDLILKFIKFAIGLLLIFISLPLIFGSYGWIKVRKYFK